MDRKTFIQKSAAMAAFAALPKSSVFSPTLQTSEMGITVASYAIRWNSDLGVDEYPAFQNALDLLNHCHSIGAGGIQVGVRGWTTDFAGRVREQRERYGMFLEGQIQLPRNEGDIDRFENEIKAGKEAGADVIRTVCLNGRR